jgi:hypothetical protein
VDPHNRLPDRRHRHTATGDNEPNSIGQLRHVRDITERLPALGIARKTGQNAENKNPRETTGQTVHKKPQHCSMSKQFLHSSGQSVSVGIILVTHELPNVVPEVE